MSDATVREMLADGARAVAATWWRVAIVILATTAIFTVGALVALSALGELAVAQRDILLNETGGLTGTGLLLLFLEIGVPLVILGLAVTAVAVAAIAKLVDDDLRGRPLRVGGALGRGVRRAPAVAGALVVAAAVCAALALLTPVLVPAAALLLVATPLVRLVSRRRRIRWPSTRRLLFLLVPFAAPLFAALRFGLFIPAAALESGGPRAALRRSRGLVPPGWTTAAATLTALLASYFALTAVLDVLQRSAIPSPVVIAAYGVAQLALFAWPIATATVLFRTLAGESPDDLAVVDPAPGPRPNVRAVAVGLSVSLVAGLIVVAPPRPASAAHTSFTVNDRRDSPDASIDGVCEATAGAGDCTLRAAVEEANAAPSDLASIDFGVSGFINVATPLVVTSPVDIDGTGQRVTLSGRGCGDCGPESQIFRFTSETAPFRVANLTFQDGFTDASSGGAIEATAPAPGSVLEAVTFAGNEVAGGGRGGALAVLGGELTVRNATFVGNRSATSASDVYAAGATTILYSTIVEGDGASSAIDSAGATTLGSSIVEPRSGAACAGTISGTHNLDHDATCPGASRVGELGTFGDHGGPVDTYSIGHASFAINRGDDDQCLSIGSVDARGEARPNDAACDIGAFEYTGPPSDVDIELTTSPPSPSDFGAPVSVTAVVSSKSEPYEGTGTVRFSRDGTSLATKTLVDGTATYPDDALDPGTYTYEVSYSGDAVLPPGVQSTNHTVATPDVSVDVTTSPAPSAAGEPVTITARVSPIGATATPSGTVTFSEGPDTLATVTMVDGVASHTVDDLPVGNHTFVADYSGDAVFPSRSGSGDHEVEVPDSSLVLTASPSPSTRGEDVVLSATVSAPGVPAKPTGTVTFFTSADPIGDAPLVDGVADLTTSALPAGHHTLRAEYPGDANYTSESGAVAHTVRAPSLVGLTSSAPSTVTGEPVTFAATVDSDPGLTPTGQVSFRNNGVEVSRSALSSSGTATFTTDALAVGDHRFTAHYEGDDLVLPGESAILRHVVEKARTTVDLTSSDNPSATGQAVHFTATVAPVAPGSGVPAGTVTLRRGADVLDAGPLDASGVARFTIDSLPTGDSTLTADYEGDGSFLASSGQVVQTVVRGATQTALSSSREPSRLGETVRFTATVSVVAPAGGTPTGVVRFLDDGLLLGEAPLDGAARASFETSDLALGSNVVTAEYRGSTDFASSATDLTQNVERWATRVDVTSSVARPVTGQHVTFTATVRDQEPSGFDPSGVVTFNEFGMTAPVDVAIDPATGQATITVPAPRGEGDPFRHSLSARYGGAAEFLPSAGGISLPVDPARIIVDVTATPPDPYMGQSVRIDVTVTPVAPSTGTPEGTVELSDHGRTLRRLTVTGGTATATFHTPGDLGQFRHEIRGAFSGRGWVPTTSDAIEVDVRKPPTALTLTVSPSPAEVDRVVELLATMTVPPGAAAPVGEPIDFVGGGDHLGSVPLRSNADGTYTARLSTSFATVGPKSVTAHFRGPFHEGSTSPAVLHEVLPREVLLTVGSSGPTRPGEQITIGVTVRVLRGRNTPTGTVDLSRDGRLVASAVPVQPLRAGLSGATFQLPGDIGTGTYQFTSRFVPSGDFAAATSSFDHVVSSYLSEVTVTPAANTVRWGGFLQVTAVVTTPTALGAPPAQGTITITSNGAPMCVTSAPEGSCFISWNDPGDHTILAEYAGNEVHGASTSSPRSVKVTRQPATILASMTPDPPVTGDPATVQWNVQGAVGGSASARIAGTQCTGGPTGSCVGLFDLSAAGRAQPVTVGFGGDRLYEPATWAGTATPVACHRLTLAGVSPDHGTIQALTPPNCNGSGYIQGTRVQVSVTPVQHPHYEWTGVEWEGIGHTTGFLVDVTVGTDKTARQVTTVIAHMQRRWNCFTAHVLPSETAKNPIKPVGGTLRLLDDPNCPVDVSGKPVHPQWRNDNGLRTGRFLSGTVLRTSPEVEADMEFYGFRFGGTDVVMDADETIQAMFGPVCNRLRLEGTGSGFTQIESRPNCGNPRTGVSGFIPGTQVELMARPEAGSYLREWRGGASGGDGKKIWRGYDIGWAVEWTAHVTMAQAPRTQTVTAVIERCSRITTRTNYNRQAFGTVERVNDGDCPTVDDEAMYTRTGTARFEAIPERGNFARWNYSNEQSDTIRFLRIPTDRDVELHATFLPHGQECVDVTIRSAPGTASLVSTSSPQDAYCLPGTLSAGMSASMSGQRVGKLPVAGMATGGGNPILGWSFVTAGATSARRAVAGAVSSTDLPSRGSMTATLAACVAVVPEVKIIFPDGSVETGGAPAGFVQLDDPDRDAPDCPFEFGAGAWRVGSNTFLAPLVNEGFEFVRWEGDAPPTPEFPRNILAIDFTAAKPQITVRAVYAARCVSLTVHDEKRIEASERPNCRPGGGPDAGPISGSYIAGTEIFLQGTMPGSFVPGGGRRKSRDHVWQGWKGDVEGDAFQNPLIVSLDKNRDIRFAYRETTFSEDTDTFFDDVEDAFIAAGDAIAETGRKAVGVVMMLAGEFLMGAGPIGAASLLVSTAGFVNWALTKMGVDTGDFETYVKAAEQTLDLLGASFSCIGAWGLSDGTATVQDYGDDDDDTSAALYATDRAQTLAEKAAAKRSRRLAAQGDSAADLAASQKAYKSSLRYKKAAEGLETAGKVLTVASVGVSIYDIAQGGGAGWAADTSAWENPDVLVKCVEDKFPDYTGMPPAN